MIRLKIIGLDGFERDVRRAGDELPPEIDRNVAKAAEIVVGAAQRNFTKDRTRARRQGRPESAIPDMLAVDYGMSWKSL